MLSHVQLFWDPMDCSPPGPSVHGILQASILQWVARPRDQTQVSCIWQENSLPLTHRGSPRVCDITLANEPHTHKNNIKKESIDFNCSQSPFQTVNGDSSFAWGTRPYIMSEPCGNFLCVLKARPLTPLLFSLSLLCIVFKVDPTV